MGQGLKPCPRCMRQMDASREVCVYCAQMGEITLPSPPVRTAAASGSPLIPILIGVVVLLVAAVGVLFVMVLQKPSTAPGAQVVKAAPAPTLKPVVAPAAQPAVAPPPAAATSYAPAPAPSPTFQTAPNQNPRPAPTGLMPARHVPTVEERQAVAFLEQVDQEFMKAAQVVRAAPVGIGVSHPDADLAVETFGAGLDGARTKLEATLERMNVNPYVSGADLRHFHTCLEEYSEATQALKTYLLTGDTHWIIQAAAARTRGVNEKDAVKTVLGF